MAGIELVAMFLLALSYTLNYTSPLIIPFVFNLDLVARPSWGLCLPELVTILFH